MVFHFNIEYKTVYGENIVLNLNMDNKKVLCKLGTADGLHWSCDLDVVPKAKNCTYFYSVERNGVCVKAEWQVVKHRLNVTAERANDYTIYDRWRDIPEDSYLYSSAFTDCINHQQPAEVKDSVFAKTIRLIVRAPQLKAGECLALVGAAPLVGAWDVKRAMPMVEQSYNEWTVDINVEALAANYLEFKFVALNDKKRTCLWETGYNRCIEIPEMKGGAVISYELGQSFLERWNRKLAGTLVPVFSLRSKESAGVGDFGDLKSMIDLVAKTGQKVLQLLPINDTTITHTWTDSYPYSCISVFAIHPQYADLRALPELEDAKLRAAAEKIRAELNVLPQIDYEKVNDFKIKYLHQIFNQEGEKMMKSAEYQAFFQETEQWLVPYAQYSYLRDKNGTADFSKWPDHNTWDEKDRKALSNPRTKAYKEVKFFYFLQYVLNKQMQEAHEYAKEKGVILKGDIPIGVNR